MQVNVMLFGRLADITGSRQVAVQNVQDTNQLLQQLKNNYPALGNLPYLVAVDEQVISDNTMLTDGSVVALLPPYSGG
jgi:molybdopterin synthase sulfur carrier subunit